MDRRRDQDRSTTRCFLALTFREADLAAAVERLDGMRGAVGGGRVKWIAPENLHLTLYFFGDLDARALARARRAVAGLGGAWDPVEVSWGDVGCFPSARRAQVIWLGLREKGGGLTGFAGWVHRRLRDAGFPEPDKPFRPHLTLGRVRRGDDVSWDEIRVGAGLTVDGPPFIIRSMRLFQSELRPQGPLYTALVSAPSRGGDPPIKGD